MNKIYVYWWALGERGAVDNYGDILAPFLAEKLSGKQVVKVSHPMSRWYKWFIKHYVTVGSIICAASKNSIVWGSGIIKQNENVRAAKFVAVRGPRTRKRLLELGYEVPEVYGDPALLLPKFISNTVTTVKVINLMTDDVVKTTLEILECKQIISSSLHGVIVSHAYEIPALWVKFSTKLAGDNIKFYDYFESLDIHYTHELFSNPTESTIADFEKMLTDNTSILLPSKDKLIQTQEVLFASCPFKNNHFKSF